jgi:hypothetical protein
VGGRLAEFQRNWEAICRDWSQRWSRRVSGWWIDACYFADEMYRLVITWDVPIQKSGLIPEPFVAQLRSIGRARATSSE